MKVTYTVDQLPTRGFGAFCPTLTVTPTASTGGLSHRRFYPGTLRVPSPAPTYPGVAGDHGTNQPTRQSHAGAPEWFLPAIGIVSADNMAPPVAVQCDNALPVPSINPQRLAQQNTYVTRVGGRTATPWPRPMTRWPTYGGGTA